MKKISLHQIDAFTNKLFGGNPAGVVFNADILTDLEMKQIAREMNLSETAFVLNPTQTGPDLKLRYFTSGKAEIKFCGHATIGALFALARAGKHGMGENGDYSFSVETNAGILPMRVSKNSQEDIHMTFSAPGVQFVPYKSQHKEIAARLGISGDVINKSFPVMIDKNLNYIYFAINSLQELGKLEFNFQQIMDNFRDEGIVIFCLLTPETFEKENHIHARGLAPLVGVPEDPFTGSMQAGLATYVRTNKIVPDSLRTIRTEQGNFIERPGFASIGLPSSDSMSYVITGQAVHVFSAEVCL